MGRSDAPHPPGSGGFMEPLTLPGTLEALGPIRRYVQQAAEAAGLEARASYNLSLAVDEIATNTVLHGYEEQGQTGDITVRAILDAQALTIVVEDTAPPFDPFTLREPESLDLPLEQRAMGGLGVWLALRNVHEFRYEYTDHHNRNIFVMQRSPQT
jgi:anti-sigma regulatory factor (Ser/Thr protein kinase)